MNKLLALGAVLGTAFLFVWQLPANASPILQVQSNGEVIRGVGAASNLPPVCCIGPNCTHLGLVVAKKCEGATTSFLLDASGSYDPEGQPLTFSWTACPGSVISNPSAAITTVTLDTSVNCGQVCAVRLKVNDGERNAFCRVFIESIEAVPICPTKPRQIEYSYTGLDCGSSNYIQDPAGVTCVGDPAGADPVRIVVTKANKPGEVYFDGIVFLGDPFVEDGAGFPSGKVAPNTRIQIFDMMGALLQDTSFHTSCSQPLEVGDQFGAALIIGFTH
jgi:hypothetical protein